MWTSRSGSTAAVRQMSVPRRAVGSEPGLRFEAVSHRYGRRGRPVIDTLSFVLQVGVTGLVGVNGAGKTTLIRMAAGALAPWRGTVSCGDADLYRDQRRRGLSRIAWMPQTALSVPGLTAHELVTYTTWMRGCSWTEARRRATQALDAVELSARASSRTGRLSGGMVRRVWLAQALAAQSQVLLLDEPSTGLDPRQRATMVRLLGQITDRVVLLSSHILEDVAELADRVLVLDQGRIVYDGDRPACLDAAWFQRQTGAGGEP